ncbi:MAG: DUF2281 domain-containing protein [Methylobacter sp.]
MPHSIQEITAKINALPEPIQQEVLDFIEFMRIKVAHQTLPSKDKPTKKRRTPPPQFAGQVKELGDVMSTASAADWGQME